MSDFEVVPPGTTERLKQLEALLGEVLEQHAAKPCLCGKPGCLAGRKLADRARELRQQEKAA